MKKIGIGMSLLLATNLMAAKSASEQIGSASFNKATITCEADGKKNFINDTVDIDNIGFDYTKFIPILEKRNKVSCSIKGMVELPSDLAAETVDIEVTNAKNCIDYYPNGWNFYSTINIQGIYDDSILREATSQIDSATFKAGRFFNVPVQQKAGMKYVEYEIYSTHQNGSHAFAINGNQMPTFFKKTENFKIKYLKLPTKRTEVLEIVELDKFFIFERKKK